MLPCTERVTWFMRKETKSFLEPDGNRQQQNPTDVSITASSRDDAVKNTQVNLSLFQKTYRDHAANVIESRFNVPFNESDPSVTSMLETAVYKSAEECLNLLSERLGDDPYLFGQAPSSADAILYGYLAPLLMGPWPNPSLKNFLKACENLTKFVNRITIAYFSKFAIEYEKKMADIKAANQPEKNYNGVEPVNKTRLAVAGCVAATAMSAYVFHKRSILLENVISSSSNYVFDSNEDNEEEEDDEDYK